MYYSQCVVRAYGHQIKEEDVRGARDTQGGFLWENLREREHLRKPAVDGKIRFILKKRNGKGAVNCIHLAQGKDKW